MYIFTYILYIYTPKTKCMVMKSLLCICNLLSSQFYGEWRSSERDNEDVEGYNGRVYLHIDGCGGSIVIIKCKQEAERQCGRDASPTLLFHEWFRKEIILVICAGILVQPMTHPSFVVFHMQVRLII